VRLSAILVVKNEAHCLERCLRSVSSVADEIIVLDSGSTDETVSIARSFGAKVEIVDWPGFGEQKNRALRRASGEWVLAVDADEHLTPELAASIRAAIESPDNTVNGYFIRYLNTWCGKPVYFGDWSRKRHLRLFRRASAHFTDSLVHEHVICPPPHETLDGLMIHDTVATEAEAEDKCRRYAALSAQDLAALGRGGLWSALTHSVWTFLRGFLLKGGFLDGAAGWKLAVANAKGTWLRYRLAGQQRAADRSTPETQLRLIGVGAVVIAFLVLAAIAARMKGQPLGADSTDTEISSQSRRASPP
jgi:glycosyltransferase involved in cell wall biosynthesis